VLPSVLNKSFVFLAVAIFCSHCTEHQGSTDVTTGNLREIKNPTYQIAPIKTKQKSDSHTIKMDDGLHKAKKSMEPIYDAVEVCKDNNDDAVKIDLNPSYNVSSTIKVDSNVRKDKGSTAKTYQKFK